MNSLRATFLLLVVALAAACSSGGGSGTATPRRDRRVITTEELAAIQAPSVYEAVERLRPEFFRSRGATSINNPTPDLPVVYVDNVRAGGIESLRQLRTNDVFDIQLISSSDATTRFGTGHTGGAILVRTTVNRRS